MALPTDSKERKRIPIVTGCFDYFPDALAEIAKVSLDGNEQHGIGLPLKWDRSKSSDDVEALGRHLLERGQIDERGIRTTGRMAWRALAVLQKEIESEKGKENV